MDIEKYDDLIESLGGEKKIEELHKKLGSEKISFVSLKRFIKMRKIILTYEQKKSVAKAATEHGVAKITVYRLLRKFRKYRKK